MKVICITNHELLPDQKMADLPYKSWKDAYIEAIRSITACRPYALVLREKLLSGIDYTNLYQSMMRRGADNGVPVIWHDHYEALKLYMRFHKKEQWPKAIFFSGREAGALSIIDLKELKGAGFMYGLPCHSITQLDDVVKSRADFMMASHIYPTDCKAGLKPKGISFLTEVCESTDIPVIALGGINPDNASACIQAGAVGVAVMSLCMAEDKEQLKRLISM